MSVIQNAARAHSMMAWAGFLARASRAIEVNSFVMYKQSIETSTFCSLCNFASGLQRVRIFLDRVTTRD